MKKPGHVGLVLFIIALLLTGCGRSLASKSLEIPPKQDYSLIPVYTLDGRSVYLNAGVTPLEFFSVNCSHCQKDLPEIQEIVTDLKAQKPIIYVATFFATSDVQEAIKETKEFISAYKIAGTVVIQAGHPQAYVKSVPSLVTLDKDTATPNITEGMPTKERLMAVLSKDNATITTMESD
ncbi:TlpA family protein disulfide reductase [Desulfosporosinus shakirovi]|uniref:TlpA family protein disulfide reductase n=1 Tax=Desulfosporosinus shakirovi TaxID=2885154 RepID=UPI001E298EA7|nr:hypothetical protein [Desulfosporosinus sp. SRJS8]MCB8818609.1 hypothetical protein [Desulfosporosinus sp. SRJS8]